MPRLTARLVRVGLAPTLLLGALAAPAPVAAAPAAADAASLFAEARAICARDGGRLWGRSLCGPILLVDYTDLGVLASQADAQGRLVRGEGTSPGGGALYRGMLPEDVIVANTPTEWAGVRWTQIVGPLPTETGARRVMLAHELFHRIQPLLGLTRPEQPNQHLDTLEGRYLLQLEWRALAAALSSPTRAGRRAAVADALALRRVRYGMFPGAAAEERALEINEGVPEYTGVRLGLATARARVAFALHDLSAFVAAPSFVRSFAYATGPAYGLLLDRAAPRWRQRLLADARRGVERGLDERLGKAMNIDPSAPGDLDTLNVPPVDTRLAARYDRDGRLRAAEVAREDARQARLADYRARLVDGPVLVLPLAHSNTQFNPQTLVPLAGQGTVYPTMRLTDDWGALEVERNGALVRADPKPGRATVSAVGANPTGTRGDGWTLKLTPGWTVGPGARPSDLTVSPPPPTPSPRP